MGRVGLQLSVAECECTLGVLRWEDDLRLLSLTISSPSTLLSMSPVSHYLFSIYISCSPCARDSVLLVALSWSQGLLPWLGDGMVWVLTLWGGVPA